MLLLDLMEIARHEQWMHVDTGHGAIEGNARVLHTYLTGGITLTQVERIEAMDDTLFVYLQGHEEEPEEEPEE